jgi:hypothetical protein
MMKLRADINFVPCPVSDGDEYYRNGIFVFNITKMTEFITDNPKIFVPEEVRVNDFRDFLSLNETHLDFVDISRPVISAEISPFRYSLIDGQHRIEKAFRLGQETILAYRLTVQQHIRFLTSSQAYESYVGYWNSKLEDNRNDY